MAIKKVTKAQKSSALGTSSTQMGARHSNEQTNTFLTGQNLVGNLSSQLRDQDQEFLYSSVQTGRTSGRVPQRLHSERSDLPQDPNQQTSPLNNSLVQLELALKIQSNIIDSFEQHFNMVLRQNVPPLGTALCGESIAGSPLREIIDSLSQHVRNNTALLENILAKTDF